MGKKGKKLKIFSALEVANICGVVNQTAINWIKNGYLKAFTTPGGQYRVYAENLIDFIENRGMILPDELKPYIVSAKGALIVHVIDPDNTFGDLFKDKSIKEGLNFDITVSETSFQAGYFLAKKSPDIVIIKKSFIDVTPEKIKTLLKTEKSDIPLVIYISDTDNGGENRGFSDFIIEYPVDFKILFDYIAANAGKNKFAGGR